MNALILSGDSWHAPETIHDAFLPLAEKGFDFEFCASASDCPAGKLREFPLVVLAKANMISAMDDRIWLTSDSEIEFHHHLQPGAALLVVHGGTCRYGDLKFMRQMTGGAFLRHPPQCSVTLEPKPSHPVAQGVENFTVHDEHYFMAYEGPEADVFLRSHSEHGTQPAGWTRIVEGRRICVLTPGHHLEVWRHPEYQKLLLNALRWAASQN